MPMITQKTITPLSGFAHADFQARIILIILSSFLVSMTEFCYGIA